MLEDLQLPKRLTPCKVRDIIESLDKKDQDILNAALLDTNWPDRTLANALTAKGLMISDTPIRKHRNKGCSCAR
jgi:hypothetical protein